MPLYCWHKRWVGHPGLPIVQFEKCSKWLVRNGLIQTWGASVMGRVQEFLFASVTHSLLSVSFKPLHCGSYRNTQTNKTCLLPSRLLVVGGILITWAQHAYHVNNRIVRGGLSRGAIDSDSGMMTLDLVPLVFKISRNRKENRNSILDKGNSSAQALSVQLRERGHRMERVVGKEMYEMYTLKPGSSVCFKVLVILKFKF